MSRSGFATGWGDDTVDRVVVVEGADSFPKRPVAMVIAVTRRIAATTERMATLGSERSFTPSSRQRRSVAAIGSRPVLVNLRQKFAHPHPQIVALLSENVAFDAEPFPLADQPPHDRRAARRGDEEPPAAG